MFAKVSGLFETPRITITHGDLPEVSFHVSTFGKKNIAGDHDVFQEINAYWRDLTEVKQLAVFNLYREIEAAFSSTLTKNDLQDYLIDKVAALTSFHSLADIGTWLSFRYKVVIPDLILDSYEESNDNNNSREKTYIKSDYLELVRLSISLRCMVPIWGEYITNIRGDTGNEFKEFYAFRLLGKSALSNCPAMEKVRLYVESMIGGEKNSKKKTLRGVSSEDYGYMLTTMVCVRKLCIADIRVLDPKQHLVTFLYNFVYQKIHGKDNNTENVVKEKIRDSKGPDGENKISSLERYKIKSDISPEDIVLIESVLSEVRMLSNNLTCHLDPMLLERSLETCQRLAQFPLTEPQIILLRWVFKPMVPQRGIMYMQTPVTINALGALEAVLWARGHKYLALLATSHPIVIEGGMAVSPTASKSQIPQELIAEVEKWYPFTRAVGQRRAVKDISSVKETNLTITSIDELADLFCKHPWRATAHEQMITEVNGSPNRHISIIPSIRAEIAKLVIELGSRSWT